MKLIVTGGAGFIGSAFIRYMLARFPSYQVVNLDSLTYAGNLENLKSVQGNPNYSFVRGDITNLGDVEAVLSGGADGLVNFAAESHVDRSIVDASQFVRTNVLGTQVLLEISRQTEIKRFIQVSTDEVYGSLEEKGRFTENSPLSPNSPYAASKTAADMLVRAYHRTYGMDVITTRCCNNYGPFQFPEKFVPLAILNAMEEHSIPIYGDGLHTRDWIHVEDHCSAIAAVLAEGVSGETYNIGANQEEKNLELAYSILQILEKPSSLVEFVRDRPGHDRRYAVDATRLRCEVGWEPGIPLMEGLQDTVKWYAANQSWVSDVKSGEYRGYYKKMYEEREETLDQLGNRRSE